MEKPGWLDKLYFKFGPDSAIPIRETVYPNLSGEPEGFFRDHQLLQQYDINKIKGTKAKNTYRKEQLKPIAQILGIRPELDKAQLASEILRVWRLRYPEDFESL